jgi:hypothetical protein
MELIRSYFDEKFLAIKLWQVFIRRYCACWKEFSEQRNFSA